MARYWIYLNDAVAGPYGIDQLIRVRGFSRQTLVCVDDGSTTPKNWISPAEIPELAHIFKAVEEHLAAPPTPAPKPAPKPVAPRPQKPFVPAVTLKPAERNTAHLWGWIVLASVLLGTAAFVWLNYARKGALSRDQEAARALVENARLPPPSPYGTLPQYFEEKGIKPRWEFEKMQDGLYRVTLSAYAPTLTLYSFEVNIPAQTVRGLNSAATKLLSEGFPAPPGARSKAPKAEPKKPSAELFSQAIQSHQEAVEGGDFSSVWDSFSDRKRSEMAKGGISRDGFIRLQGLTHRVESAVKLEVLKTKQQSDTEMLILLRQTQNDRPDVFLKQLWVFENGAWKLDDEQKKMVAPEPSAAPPAAPSASTPVPTPTTPVAPASNEPAPSKPSPASLPGMSN
jgi:hypothetical protein